VPARRVKVEFYDHAGAKHTISIEGSITKEKITRVLDYVELMGRVPDSFADRPGTTTERKLERVRALVDHFQGKAFTSADVQQAYEQRHGERIALSTVCTYLSRFVDRGVVVRSGSSSQWLYSAKPAGTFSWDNIVQK